MLKFFLDANIQNPNTVSRHFVKLPIPNFSIFSFAAPAEGAAFCIEVSTLESGIVGDAFVVNREVCAADAGFGVFAVLES